jgi:hypothetical protein
VPRLRPTRDRLGAGLLRPRPALHVPLLLVLVDGPQAEGREVVSERGPETAVTDSAAETHEMDLEEDFIDGTSTAECSCGWESAERNAEADAIDDWENHCDVVFMEATGG